jgi:Tol biopolymer transport system component/predicted Ser/Thr protein kinase
MVGQTLGHYRIEAKLGVGGMGVVYRARDTRLNRLAALKFLPPDKVADPDRKRRFVQEAQAASALNHANIVTIYEIGSDHGVDFLAMEYIAGKTLDELIPRGGMRLAKLLKYAIQVADALTRAHAAGIVHRDIKPTNIMATPEGHVKVLDFGLAKLTERTPEEDPFDHFASTRDAPPRTEEGALVGTVAYMSSEQAAGRKVDSRSDIFSFGSLLYEMATGRRPFQGDTTMSTMAAILTKEPQAVHELAPDAPRDLERIIARCLRKDRDRRFQHMDDVKVALEDLKEESESGKLETAAAPATRFSIRRGVAVVVLVLGALVAGTGWWLARQSAPAPATAHNLVRLTSHSGLATTPALSVDGKLLAYASDHSGEGNLDLYILQLGGSEPIRITRGPLDNSAPSFSPDSTRIVFRSERDGGGVYIAPALGGEARLLVKNGRRPRFSPDGAWIAYAIGERQAAELFVIPGSGVGAPQRVQTGFRQATNHVWAPDSKRILFVGLDPEDQERNDWWVAPLETGPVMRTGALKAFRERAMGSGVVPSAWTEGDQVMFSVTEGDHENLWQIPISPKTWTITGVPQRLTFGTGLEILPAVGASRVVFSSQVSNHDIWALPTDTMHGKVLGEVTRLTRDAALDTWPSASGDGKKVVFTSRRSGNSDVWMKALDDGKETALTTTGGFTPQISRDGSKVAYQGGVEPRGTIYVVALGTGGAPGVVEKVCDDCGRPDDWSPDLTKILLLNPRGGPGGAGRLQLLDLAAGGQPLVVEHPKNFVGSSRLSDDGHWISFVETPAASRRQIFIASLRGRTPVPQSEWIPITDGSGLDREPRWSPDANLLYFLSERDGFRCFWAQSLESATKRPIGAAFPVQHFHRSRFDLRYSDTGTVGFALARDKIVFAMGETTGNIWMVQP